MGEKTDRKVVAVSIIENVQNIPIPDSVLLDVRAAQPREALRQVARALELSNGIDGAAVHAALMAAEMSGGSAIGDGVAVVGVRVPVHASGARVCGIAKLARPVVFRGVEDHPCDIVCVLVSPEDEAQLHLCHLSALIRAFRDMNFLQAMRDAVASDKIVTLFKARGMKVARRVA